MIGFMKSIVFGLAIHGLEVGAMEKDMGAKPESQMGAKEFAAYLRRAKEGGLNEAAARRNFLAAIDEQVGAMEKDMGAKEFAAYLQRAMEGGLNEPAARTKIRNFLDAIDEQNAEKIKEEIEGAYSDQQLEIIRNQLNHLKNESLRKDMQADIDDRLDKMKARLYENQNRGEDFETIKRPKKKSKRLKIHDEDENM